VENKLYGLGTRRDIPVQGQPPHGVLCRIWAERRDFCPGICPLFGREFFLRIIWTHFLRQATKNQAWVEEGNNFKSGCTVMNHPGALRGQPPTRNLLLWIYFCSFSDCRDAAIAKGVLHFAQNSTIASMLCGPCGHASWLTPLSIKGINTAGQALHQKQIRDLRPPAAASAASRGVLNPSVPHSLDHARASTVAISLRSSIMHNEQLAAARHSWSADYAVAPVTGIKSA
jgi:hypothetical protein